MYANINSYQDLFEELGLPLIVLSGDCSIVDVNTKFLECFQLSKLQLEKGAFRDADCQFYLEDGRLLSSVAFLHHCVHSFQLGDTSQTIGVTAGKGESRKWFRVTLSMLLGSADQEKRILVSLVDITKVMSVKDSHREIALAKNEWETTVDALQDIVTIQNMDMEIVRANRVAHELFGFKLGELKNRKCYEAFLGESQPCLDCPIVKTGVDGCPHTGLVHNDTVNKTFQVSSFPILNENGRMQQLVHVAKDVSQFLKDESEKNRLMAAIEQTSEAVVMTDVDGNIRYVNPAFEKASGYGKEEVFGQNTRILKSGEHDQRFYKSLWKTLLNKEVWQGKLKNRHKNGEIYVEDATISPVLNSDGDITNFVAVKRSITREEELEHQLRHASKMEALGTLAGGIAHDFNNILSAMIGYGEIARGKLDLKHPVQSDLQQILDGGDRAVDLVKQILTFGRLEVNGSFSVLKLEHIISETIEFLRPSLPPTIDLNYEIEPNCGSVYGDASQLYQVVMNLCTNARQAIGDAHGSINITLRTLKTEDKSRVAQIAQESNNYLLLQVRDNGCGIKQDNIAKLFDPFFTTKQKEQGTGLGLSVVHGIIQKHKGVIKVESSVGSGATFSIYLPLDGRALEVSQDKEQNRAGGNERIMVIDDEVQVAKVTAASLTRVGYRVSLYNDSMQAVMAFREDPFCCDLVITDMMMPNMTGAELARELLSMRRELPIIMMTGYSEHFDRERSEQIGLKGYLHKPVKANDLRQVVRKVLNNG